MNHAYIDATTTPQHASSRHNISARQPVSCEPCRHRKIKCSRTKPTCETCVRRRCSERCVYKNVREGDSQVPAPSSNDELLNRISNLEQLLRKHTGADIPGRLGGYSAMPSPPTETGRDSQFSPESSLSESLHQPYSSDYQSPLSGGVLTSSSSGNVRYEPRPSQWTSILANTNLSIETPSLDDQEDTILDCGFPFTGAPASSSDELLALLPPTQQCDYLKNQYFAVFSPVSFILISSNARDYWARYQSPMYH